MRKRNPKRKPLRPDKQSTRFYVKRRGSVRKVWENREGGYYIILKGEKIDVSHLPRRFMRLDDPRMRNYRNTMQSSKMRGRGRRR